jgi:hypothetical protein
MFEVVNVAEATVIRGSEGQQEVHIQTEADAEVIPKEES